LLMTLIMSKTSARSKTAVVIADCKNGNTVCRVSRTYPFETGRSVSDMSLSACGARNFLKTGSAYYQVVVAARSSGQWRS
jgi:hypothetical protein